MLMQVFSIAGAMHSSLKLYYLFTSRTGLLLITGAAFSRSAAAAYWPQYYEMVGFLSAGRFAFAGIHALPAGVFADFYRQPAAAGYADPLRSLISDSAGIY